MDIDLKLLAHLPVQRLSQKDGTLAFYQLLRELERIPLFDLGWMMKEFHLWADAEAYLDHVVERAPELAPTGEEFGVSIVDDGISRFGRDEVYYGVDFDWGPYHAQASAQFRRPHPTHGLAAEDLVATVSAFVGWKRPMHLECGPIGYFLNHHPLGIGRRGIGWIGWLPFDIAASDVPEAEVVQPMNGGTLVMTQRAFWQPMKGHPDYSKEAIERAQEVEIRLNLLGVLPTAVELERGDWGQR